MDNNQAHQHSACEHEFKHCPICNTVYCAKCGSQWYGTKPEWIIHPAPQPQPYFPNTAAPIPFVPLYTITYTANNVLNEHVHV